jgi:hypothetical protein
MPRATKITKQVQEVILDAVRSTGDEVAAYQWVDISKTAYSRFKQRSPEFCIKVEEAKQQYLDKQKGDLIAEVEKTRKDIWDYRRRCLAGQEFKNTYSVQKNSAGEVLWTLAKKERVLPHEDWLKLFDVAVEEQEFVIRIEVAEPSEDFNAAMPGDEDL